jgi:hypothetical protein
MTYEEATRLLVHNDFTVSIWTNGTKTVRLQVYCSPILFEDKRHQIEDLLGGDFKAFIMPNHDAIYVEMKRGISPDNGLKAV